MLESLSRLREGRTRRVSSYDTTGGNADFWRIEGGETRVLAALKGAGCRRPTGPSRPGARLLQSLNAPAHPRVTPSGAGRVRMNVFDEGMILFKEYFVLLKRIERTMNPNNRFIRCPEIQDENLAFPHKGTDVMIRSTSN